METLKRVFIEIKSEVITFLWINLHFLPGLLRVVLAYVWLWLVFRTQNSSEILQVGIVVGGPVLTALTGKFAATWVGSLGHGDSVPVARKRFTSYSQSGVTIRKEDSHEIVTYLFEVENYIDRKGLRR